MSESTRAVGTADPTTVDPTQADPTRGLTAWAEVDLDAIRDNVAALRGRSASGALMAVVKADAYGHGLVHSARAALAGGADYLGIAQLTEAIALREAGVDAPLLAWIFSPGAPLADAVSRGIDISIASRWALAETVAAARATGRTARIHVKVDTGLGRGGAFGSDYTDLLSDVGPAVAEGAVELVGIFSHFIFADAPEHPTVRAQQERFVEACAEAERAGLRPQLRHLANSAATLTNPSAHFDMVRPGLAVYGLSPVPDLAGPEDYGLTEAMRLVARLPLVKRLPAGQGISYGHTYTTAADTTVGLVPLGYADGIPRAASNVAPVQIGGARQQISGRVCMDQFVVDLGPSHPAQPGDEAVLFGRGVAGEPTAQDWAAATDTINYEIVTRVGARVPRIYRGADRVGKDT
ncbi:MAG: alanine racemase [Micrococcales bacterium]|nr:alanine racemase [Micrococcales bacterium]